MRTVELAGTVGAGKTSLVEPLRTLLASQGREAMTLSEGGRLLAVAGVGRMATVRASGRFMARHPLLVAHAARSLVRAPIPWWHRRHIFLKILRLGAELELLAARLSADATLIIDEGWLHRSVNLFAWREPTPAPDEIARYLDLAPLSQTTIVVDAPTDASRARVAGRGLPKRLRDREAVATEAFLSRSDRVIGIAVGALLDHPRGTRLVRVPNDGLVAELPDALARALAERSRPGGWRRHRQVWPSVPRPDRLVRRLSARGSGSLGVHEMQLASAEFGLPQPVRVSRAPSPGGRGSVGIIADAAGQQWLLKRYKPSVADEDLVVEHAVLERLAEVAFPAPRLRRSPSGSTIVRVGDGRLALFMLASGHVHPHERIYAAGDRRRLEMEAGATLGQLHESLCGFEPPPASENGFVGMVGPRLRPLAWFSERLERLARSTDGRDRRLPELTASAGWMHRELIRHDALLEAAAPARTVIHGDYGPYNLMLRPGWPPLVIDFELARVDWRLADLATAVPRFAQRRTGFDRAAAGRFLDGYRSSTTLDAQELGLMPAVATYLALRRAVVCWERFAASAERQWADQARGRLGLARSLVAGRHPLAALEGS